MEPKLAAAYIGRGVTYQNKGLNDQAIADFSKAIALPLPQPDLASTYLGRGVSYEHKGTRDQAIADYREALALNPNMKAAQEGLTRLGATP